MSSRATPDLRSPPALACLTIALLSSAAALGVWLSRARVPTAPPPGRSLRADARLDSSGATHDVLHATLRFRASLPQRDWKPVHYRGGEALARFVRRRGGGALTLLASPRRPGETPADVCRRELGAVSPGEGMHVTPTDARTVAGATVLSRTGITQVEPFGGLAIVREEASLALSAEWTLRFSWQGPIHQEGAPPLDWEGLLGAVTLGPVERRGAPVTTLETTHQAELARIIAAGSVSPDGLYWNPVLALECRVPPTAKVGPDFLAHVETPTQGFSLQAALLPWNPHPSVSLKPLLAAYQGASLEEIDIAGYRGARASAQVPGPSGQLEVEHLALELEDVNLLFFRVGPQGTRDEHSKLRRDLETRLRARQAILFGPPERAEEERAYWGRKADEAW